MAKNSDTMHRVAATFQGGRDPDQDAVIQWLSTLPKNDKGQLHRSALKYHMMRAILQYINSGLTTSQTPVGVVLAAPVANATTSPHPVVAVVASAPAKIVVQPTGSGGMPGSSVDNIPVLTEAIVPATSGGVPKKSGLLRSRIRNSMSNGSD